MSAPIVSFYDRANASAISKWDIGVIDANSESPEQGILVWNNRGGAEDVSDMQECTVTVLDNNLGDTGPVVSEKWVKLRCDSMAETSFTPIGGSAPAGHKSIKAKDQQPGMIKGTKNDGTATATASFAEITTKVAVPLNAPAGPQEFKLRVKYYYT